MDPMRRALGPNLLFILIAFPAILAPAIGLQPSTSTEGEPTAAPASEADFSYDAVTLRDQASTAPADESQVAQRMYLLTSGVYAKDELLEQRSTLQLEPAAGSLAAVEVNEPEVAAESQEPATGATPMPLQALLVLEAQRTLVAVGLTTYPGISSHPIRIDSIVEPPYVYAASVAYEAVQAGVPAWLLQVTWILTLVAIGLTLRPCLVAGAVALFSRFNQSDVLDHERRGRLFAAIQADPGASFGELCQRAGLAAGVAQHHLRLLEQHGLLRRVRDGRATRFYPRGPRIGSAALRSATRARLVDVLREEPQIDAKQLADRLGQRPQSTWHHLRILQDAGILVPTRVGRGIRWDVSRR